MNNNCIAKAVKAPEEAIQKLILGNEQYLKHNYIKNVISNLQYNGISEYGQMPYAVIVTCSDSRVLPESIFSANSSELFVIRTAGNVVNHYVLGSIEYGVSVLGAKVVIVMGHTHCGAVKAAIGGLADGHIKAIVNEIRRGIANEADPRKAEDLNIEYCAKKILRSDTVSKLAEQGYIKVVKAKYDIMSGRVTFFE